MSIKTLVKNETEVDENTPMSHTCTCNNEVVQNHYQPISNKTQHTLCTL